MPFPRLLVLAVLALAFTTPVASAAPAVTTLSREPVAREPAAFVGRFVGPYRPRVAGTDVLWARDATRGEGAVERTAIVAAPVGGGPRRLVFVGGREVDLDAGAGGALAAQSTDSNLAFADRYTPYEISGQRVHAGPLGGPFALAGGCIGPFAAEGARVATVGGERCDAIVVRDALAGREVARFPIAGSEPVTVTTLLLAGDHVVWGLRGPATRYGIGDVATGVAAPVTLPGGHPVGLARDGRMAILQAGSLALRAPDGSTRAVAGLTVASPIDAVLGFAGDDLVVSRDDVAGRGSAVDAVTPDGAIHPLLRAALGPSGERPQPRGAVLGGVDAEGDRLAWIATACDDAVVQTATLAALKVEPLDLRVAQPCPRPRIDRARLTLDRHGRTAVPIRCPTACAGRLALTARDSAGRPFEVGVRRFAFARPGRHRIALRVAGSETRWLRALGRGGRAIVVSVNASAGGRPVYAERDGRIRPVA